MRQISQSLWVAVEWRVTLQRFIKCNSTNLALLTLERKNRSSGVGLVIVSCRSSGCAEGIPTENEGELE